MELVELLVHVEKKDKNKVNVECIQVAMVLQNEPLPRHGQNKTYTFVLKKLLKTWSNCISIITCS